MIQWIFNILIGIDQLANAILGGDPDETISSRMGKALTHCQLCRLICRIIHPLDKNHCKKSIEKDEGSKERWSW